MSTDMPESKWKQVCREATIYWAKIDDADLATIAGKADRLAGVLQHKYGYTKQYADMQSIRWMHKHGDDQASDE